MKDKWLHMYDYMPLMDLTFYWRNAPHLVVAKENDLDTQLEHYILLIKLTSENIISVTLSDEVTMI